MKNYTVKITFIPTNVLAHSSTTSNDLSNLDELNDASKQGFKGFFLTDGDSDAGSGCWLDGTYKCFDDDGYPGWVGTDVSKEDGTFDIPQVITITGDMVENIVILFDKVAGEYATEVNVNGTTYTNDSYVLIIAGLQDATTVITFTKWSKVNSIPKVLAITSGLDITYDSRQIKELTYTHSAAAENDALQFGITTQSGTIVIKDKYIIKQLNDDGLLDTDLPVTILEDDVEIEKFIAADIDESTLNLEWSFVLSDITSYWDEQQFEGLDYVSTDLLSLLTDLIPTIIFIDDAQDLENLNIPTAFLNMSTKREAITKCCQIGLLRIYQIMGKVYARRVI